MQEKNIPTNPAVKITVGHNIAHNFHQIVDEFNSAFGALLFWDVLYSDTVLRVSTSPDKLSLGVLLSSRSRLLSYCCILFVLLYLQGKLTAGCILLCECVTPLSLVALTAPYFKFCKKTQLIMFSHNKAFN